MSIGPDSTGPESAGLDSADPDSADPDSADPDSADPDSAGPASAGRDSTGTRSEPSSAAVTVEILGAVRAARDGVPLDPGPPLRRRLLALLAARAGEPASMDTIIDLLWPGDPPRRAVNVVHGHVGALRRRVEPDLPPRAQGRWLHSTPTGYRIDPDAVDLDLLRFRALRSRARHRGRPAERMDAAARALGLWRGRAGADVGGGLDEHPDFTALDREHAEAALEAMRLSIESGEPERLLSVVRAAAVAHPTDETLQAELMRVLVAAGRRAEALEHFDAVREHLADALGVDPGAALRDAHLSALRDDESGGARLPPPAQLPLADPDLVGRAAELAQLRAIAADVEAATAAVAITGAPGSGKSALAVKFAQEQADRFPDGQLFVDLRGFDPVEEPRPSAEVLAHLLGALDLAPGAIPADLDARAALFRSTTAGRRMLVLLDNARDYEQVQPLLMAGRGSLLVVTSRAPLTPLLVGGSAHSVALGPLSAEESCALLASRLGATEVARQRDAADRIIEAVSGLPLALAIAAARAARAPERALAALADDLDRARSPLDPLSDRAHPGTDLRRVFLWSCGELSGDSKRALRMLALHPGPVVTVDAVARLVDASRDDADRVLVDLAALGLIEEALPGRYRMHDLVKAYAAELLEAETSDARASARARLADYAASGALAASAVLSPDRIPLSDPGARVDPLRFRDRRAADAWLRAELPFLIDLVGRRATAPQEDPAVWRIAWAIEHALDQSGGWDAVIRTMESALVAAQRSGTPPIESAVRRGLAGGYLHRGRIADAVRELEAAIALLGPADSTGGRSVEVAAVAETHRRMSWALEQAGDLPGAAEHARVAAAAYPPGDRSAPYAFALNAVGWYEFLLGRDDVALDACRRALALLEAGGDHPLGLADVHGSLGSILAHRREWSAATHHFSRALRLFEGARFVFAWADTAVDYADALIAAGHPEFGDAMLGAAQLRFAELHHPRAREVAARRSRRTGQRS